MILSQSIARGRIDVGGLQLLCLAARRGSRRDPSPAGRARPISSPRLTTAILSALPPPELLAVLLQLGVSARRARRCSRGPGPPSVRSSAALRPRAVAPISLMNSSSAGRVLRVAGLRVEGVAVDQRSLRGGARGPAASSGSRPGRTALPRRGGCGASSACRRRRPARRCPLRSSKRRDASRSCRRRSSTPNSRSKWRRPCRLGGQRPLAVAERVEQAADLDPVAGLARLGGDRSSASSCACGSSRANARCRCGDGQRQRRAAGRLWTFRYTSPAWVSMPSSGR